MHTLGRGDSETGSGLTRRDFLRVGGVGLGSLGLPLAGVRGASTPAPSTERAVILLMLVGGPSQLESFDPKPDAPSHVRGPFGSIPTALPGVRFCEHLPGLARRMDRMTLIRTLHHDSAPIHETGHQLLQTGRLCRLGHEHPHVGAAIARARGSAGDLPPFMILPGPIGNTGVGVPHGQSAGVLGRAYEPFPLDADPAAADYDARRALDRACRFLDEQPLSRPARNAFDLRAEREDVRDAYGRHGFGQNCLLARRLVESGVRLVTVNMFQTVFNRVTWDCHGASPFSTLDDYARVLLPTLDQTLSALLDDLDRRGLLETTLVVATGEFGRTPKLNAAGGRDHWPGAWSALMAGGGTRGGTVIGSTDGEAAAPADRPVTPAELVATIYRSAGIDPTQPMRLADGTELALVEGSGPIREALA